MSADITSRFQNNEDLIDALKAQRLLEGSDELARAFSQGGELVSFTDGQVLIEQGTADRDMYFLLAGKTTLIINGYRLGYGRNAGETVGEMSAINGAILRSATVEATERTVAWKVSHRHLADIGARFPDIWKRLAVVLSGRLEQRNALINRLNLKPRVFIICSKEALPIAKCLELGLEYENCDVLLWSDEQIFAPGQYPLESLEAEVAKADFGVVLAEPDDLRLSRNKEHHVPRDNVIFELGFFMSRLGRGRTLLLLPRNKDVELPSDFKGLTPISYVAEGVASQLTKSLAPTVTRISHLIQEKGLRRSLVEAT